MTDVIRTNWRGKAPPSIWDTVAALQKRVAELEALVARKAPAAVHATHHNRLSAIAGPIAEAYGIPLSDMRGESKERRFVWPRQEAMLAMREAGFSTPRIGQFFRRDHSTVMHGIAAARKRRAEG